MRSGAHQGARALRSRHCRAIGGRFLVSSDSSPPKIPAPGAPGRPRARSHKFCAFQFACFLIEDLLVLATIGNVSERIAARVREYLSTFRTPGFIDMSTSAPRTQP